MNASPSPAPRPQTVRFTVWSLEVWGHSAADCENEHAEDCASLEADPDWKDDCDCERHERCEGFSLNDRCRVGYLDLEVSETEELNDNEALFTALVDAGFLKSTLKLAEVEFEDMGETSVYVNQAIDGRPVFEIEKER